MGQSAVSEEETALERERRPKQQLRPVRLDVPALGRTPAAFESLGFGTEEEGALEVLADGAGVASSYAVVESAPCERVDTAGDHDAGGVLLGLGMGSSDAAVAVAAPLFRIVQARRQPDILGCSLLGTPDPPLALGSLQAPSCDC